MAKERIDKLFRDKLANRTFEYQDSFWEEARKGLAQSPKHPEKGSIWNIVASFLFSGLIVAGTWLVYMNQEINPAPVADPSEYTGSPVTADESTSGPDQNKPVEIAGAQDEDPSLTLNKPATPPKSLDDAPDRNSMRSTAPSTWIPESDKPKQPVKDIARLTEPGKEQLETPNDGDHPAVNNKETDKEPATGPDTAKPGDTPVDKPGGNLLNISIDSTEPGSGTEKLAKADGNETQSGTEADSSNPSANNATTSADATRRMFKWGISGFTGLTYTTPEISAATESNQDYVRTRTKHSGSVLTAEYGLLGHLYYRQWSVSTGAVFASFQEKTNYSFESVMISVDSQRINFIDSIIVRIDSNPGGVLDTIWRFLQSDTTIYDTTSTKQRDTEQEALNGKVVYRYMEIPVLFGWSYPLDDRTSLNVSGGLSLGMLRSVSGYQLDPSTNKMAAIRREDFSKNFYFMLFGTGISRELLPGWSASLNFAGKLNVTDFQANAAFNQRLTAYSLRVGFEYRF